MSLNFTILYSPLEKYIQHITYNLELYFAYFNLFTMVVS
jgi:hypothetical protein